LIRLLLEREIRTPTADDAVCSRYDDRHQTRFRSPDLFEPAHILFKARRDRVATRNRPWSTWSTMQPRHQIAVLMVSAVLY
jgi:peptidyl-prolyl cis-trans isomerase C